jgi:hypothetical protein
MDKIIEKVKLTIAAVSDCYKTMKSTADELRVKVLAIWKNQN